MKYAQFVGMISIASYIFSGWTCCWCCGGTDSKPAAISPEDINVDPHFFLKVKLTRAKPNYILCDESSIVKMNRKNLEEISKISKLNGARVFEDGELFMGAGHPDLRLISVIAKSQSEDVMVLGNNWKRIKDECEFTDIDVLIVTDKNSNTFFAVGEKSDEFGLDWLYYVKIDHKTDSNFDVALCGLEESKSSYKYWIVDKHLKIPYSQN